MDAERRQVTVLFTDMVGFTTFSERSGEEAAFTLMRSLSKLMDEAVREQGGVVQGFTGDGIMAVFGAPIAFEDAPLRACRAALSILQRLKAAGGDLEAKHGVRPQLRIGLNTGAAVVGQVQGWCRRRGHGSRRHREFRGAPASAGRAGFGVHERGDAPTGARNGRGELSPANTPSRANPSRKRPIGSMPFATGPRGLKRRSAGASAPLSDANANWRCWNARSPRRARNSVSSISLAEPGMGKSRLLHEFRQRIGKERAFVLSGSCSPDGQQTPFLPFIEVVRGSFRVSAGEAEKDVAQKLEMGLTALGLHSPRNLGLSAPPARPQSPGRRVDGARRRADRPAHARAFAAIAGGALPPLAGGHGDRGFALDRQRIGGSCWARSSTARPSCGFCSSPRAGRNTRRPGSTARW